MTVTEKAAYLKGLMDGSELTMGEKEKRIVDAAMELLADLASKVSEIDDDLSNLYDGFESVCDSLDEMEEDIDCLFAGSEGDGFRDGDDDEQLWDVECPKCGNVVCIDEDRLLRGDMECPTCGEKLEFDFSCDCDDCSEGEDGEETEQ